jgi:hypothetical protein
MDRRAAGNPASPSANSIGKPERKLGVAIRKPGRMEFGICNDSDGTVDD